MAESHRSSQGRPGSPGELFRAFQRLALQGFGGVLPVAHRELVERLEWLSEEEFIELLSLCQVLPGPNIVNLALVFGDRHFGWRGALAAAAGLMAAPLAIVLALVVAYRQHADVPMVAGALRGMGAVAAGLILATAVKASRTLVTSALGLPLASAFALATLLAIGWLRWPLVGVVLVLGPVAMAIAWRRLSRMERSG